MTAGSTCRVIGVCAGLLLAAAAAGRWSLDHWQHDAVVWIMLAAAAVYAVSVGASLHGETRGDGESRRRMMTIILGTALLARLVLLTAPPLSTDIYRYVWDGRVQAAGINPYRYRPADPALAALRDPAVYPRINRADTAVTIYPPFAQMIFLAVTRLAPRVTVMKAAMLAFDIVAALALLALLRRHGLPSTRILVYVWNPLPLFEFAGSGHVDAAAIALMLLACVAAERRHAAAAGALLGAGALVKFFPLAILPALYRRRDGKLPAALFVTMILLYLPYLGVGRGVLGFLPGYLEDEGLAAGSGFFLLNALQTLAGLPPGGALAYASAAGVLLTALAAWVILRRPPGRPGEPAGAARVPMASALLLMGTFTVLLSPHLAWYFTWFIPFLCFRPSWAFVYLTAAAPLLYRIIWSPDPLLLHAALYVPFAILLIIESSRHRRRPVMEHA